MGSTACLVGDSDLVRENAKACSMTTGIIRTSVILSIFLNIASSHNETLQDEYLYAWCEIEPNNSTQFISSHNVTGMINIQQWNDGGLVDITIDLIGFDSTLYGNLYEFHIHEFGDLSEGCESVGSYYNPFDNWVTHVGDWGSVPSDITGAIRAEFKDIETSLVGFYSVLGRSIVVHERVLPETYEDPDIWSFNDHKRLACCVINAF